MNVLQGPIGPMMLNMFDMWNSVSTKLEAQSNVQQNQQPHTSGGSIKGNFHSSYGLVTSFWDGSTVSS